MANTLFIEDANSNLTEKESKKSIQNKTVFVSPAEKLWKVHTDEAQIGTTFILKSAAIALAIKYVASHPKGNFSQIKITGRLATTYIYWTLGIDEFPPQKKIKFKY